MIDKIIGAARPGAGRDGEDRSRKLERELTKLLTNSNLSAQHQPRLGLFTDEGTEIEPDLGFLHPQADGPFRISHDAPISDVVEVKMQANPGTADQKLEGAIRRYAYVGDDHNLVPTIVSALCPVSVSSARVASIRRHADAHLVGFVALEDFSAATLLAESARIRTARIKLAATHLTVSLADRFDPQVLAAAARAAERRHEL